MPSANGTAVRFSQPPVSLRGGLCAALKLFYGVRYLTAIQPASAGWMSAVRLKEIAPLSGAFLAPGLLFSNRLE